MNKGKLLVFVGIGFELVGIMLACLYLGQKLDQNYPTMGLGIGLVPMIGLAGWIYHVVLLTNRMNSSKNDE